MARVTLERMSMINGMLLLVAIAGFVSIVRHLAALARRIRAHEKAWCLSERAADPPSSRRTLTAVAQLGKQSVITCLPRALRIHPPAAIALAGLFGVLGTLGIVAVAGSAPTLPEPAQTDPVEAGREADAPMAVTATATATSFQTVQIAVPAARQAAPGSPPPQTPATGGTPTDTATAAAAGASTVTNAQQPDSRTRTRTRTARSTPTPTVASSSPPTSGSALESTAGAVPTP